MPVPYNLRNRESLRAQRSSARTHSTNPHTQFEIKVENLVESALQPTLHAEAQKTVPVRQHVRPDIVVRENRTGKAKLVIDAKNYAGTIPVAEVEKLAGDMRVVGAARGVLYVAEGAGVSVRTEEVARRAGIAIVRDGREGRRMLAGMVVEAGGGRDGSGVAIFAGGHDSPDLRVAAGRDVESRGRTAAGPLKKDGTPDMRYAVNKAAYGGTKSSNAVAGRLTTEDPLDSRYAANRAPYSGSEHISIPPHQSNLNPGAAPSKYELDETRYTSREAKHGGHLKKMFRRIKSWRRSLRKDRGTDV
ncbi:uncharacterized protein EV422DRAFT_506235 [Fimicolochytrium jonesii]|uniref:uncharacterized protein n=1 Tax=Fimicolochytrium jonesii TaxID=1396493 RepID=UPI0022FDFFD8|nr:uncharacterized protein EV422DRAFT_506235 [Fimicolochytrium jonesii]KAI8821013.1 hypothetical protein EV422DRAFT_506235 [Fimicolochytrium jonesii]